MKLLPDYYCRLCPREYVHRGSALNHAERFHHIAPQNALDAFSHFADRRPAAYTLTKPSEEIRSENMEGG